MPSTLGVPGRDPVRTALLLCGLAASLVYVGGDILAALRWAEYSYRDQAISELMAIDAPTRPLLVALFSLFDLLMLAFGIGVWKSAGGRRALRILAVLLVAWSVVGFAGLVFAPMHPRGAATSATDVAHVVDAGILVLLIVGCMGLGAAALGRGFRGFSIAMIAVLLVFGALAARMGPDLAAGLPTPWLGTLERVNVYGAMLWIVVLAVTLLRADQGAGGAR